MNYPLLNEQMPQTIIRVWRLRRITSLIIFSLIFAASFWFLATQNWLHFWVITLWSSLLALTLISHLLSFVLMSYRYKFHRYEIQENDIAIQRGYLFRSTTYIPIRRIQHIETDQGIFLRKYALVSLQIHTAATNHTIEGLPVAQAERLRETIMNLVEVVKDDL
ncbi:MAG: PH domain-containing protein [Enterococcus sp.]|uniref:PH domain-containing protein n=1 Tax=Enterococcus sp. TaxID=35783 RepID=UPI003993E00C